MEQLLVYVLRFCFLLNHFLVVQKVFVLTKHPWLKNVGFPLLCTCYWYSWSKILISISKLFDQYKNPFERMATCWTTNLICLCIWWRFCPQCEERRQASKKLDLWRLPEVLVIHLKRFSYSRSIKHNKLETFVNFPIHDFDLTNYVANNITSRRQLYELYALTNHYGGMGSGHYTAHIKVSEKALYLFLKDFVIFPPPKISCSLSQLQTIVVDTDLGVALLIIVDV